MEAPAGFEEFVRTQSRVLLRACWLLTGDWASAEDLLQGALAATWLHWSGLSRPDAPQAYVRRVMLTSYLRSRRRRWTGEVATDDLPDRPNRHDDLAGSEDRLILIEALQTLPPRQRAVIALRFFVDLSERDTAAAMGCSVGAVKSHTARAIARLRRTDLLSEAMTQEVTE